MLLKGVKQMPETKIKAEEEKPVYCTMKMPEWFFDLDVAEKKRLIRKMATESINRHELTRGELKGLMPSAEG